MHAEIDVHGIEEIEIDVAAADFHFAFADVSSAVLDVAGQHENEWSIVRSGDTLKVSSGPRGPLSGTKLLTGIKTNAVLSLPQELNNGQLVLLLDVAACKFKGTGAFLAVVQEARIELAAGKARALLENTAKVEFDVAAGSLAGWLKGGAPSSLRVEVATGSADIIVPPVPYRVRKNVTLGSADLRVKEDASAPSLIEVEVAVGQISIEAEVNPGAQL